MVNQQAQAAGSNADEIIKNLANPAQAIVTDKTTVKVLDKAQPVEHPGQRAQELTEDNWEKRFKGFKSSADKTIHELRKQVSQFDLVNNDNSTLKEQLKEARAQIPSTPNEMLELFSEEELGGFNKMLDSRVGGLQEEVGRLTNELSAIKEAEYQTEIQNHHHDIVQAVKNAVPSYDEIDVDPDFAKWIKESDSYGNIRYDMLIAAKSSTPPDVGRIVQFYVEFANSKTVVPKAEPKQFTQQELLQNPMTLAANLGAEVPKPSGRVWNQATISQLYKDKATGKITSEVFEELEKELYQVRK